jgi:hypothetical protein
VYSYPARPALDRANISVLSSIGQRIMIGLAASVSENRRMQLSLCTLRVAMAYTEGDNGPVVRS